MWCRSRVVGGAQGSWPMCCWIFRPDPIINISGPHCVRHLKQGSLFQGRRVFVSFRENHCRGLADRHTMAPTTRSPTQSNTELLTPLDGTPPDRHGTDDRIKGVDDTVGQLFSTAMPAEPLPMIAVVSACAASPGAFGPVSNTKSMSPSSGKPDDGGSSTKSVGRRVRAKMATPRPARTAASTPLTPRTVHVTRYRRPAASSA